MSVRKLADLPVPLYQVESNPGIDSAVLAKYAFAWAVAAAMLLALIIRLQMALSAGFPVLDGGMFYTMVRDLEANHLVIPAVTTYNHAHIPFGYPPVGFYAAALINELTGVSLLSIIQFFPVVVSVLSVGAFALLARQLVPKIAAGVAVFAFALLPDAYLNQMEGGGLTRAPGQLFALLSLAAAVALYRGGQRRYIMLLAACLAATLLSHLEWALFSLVSVPVLWVSIDRTRQGLRRTVAAGVAGFALAAPWWLDLLRLHGLGPVISTIRGSGSVWPWYEGIVSLMALKVSNEAMFPLVGALALLGALVAMKRRHWLLPLWLAVLAVSESRAWSLRAAIPLAMLAGLGVEAVVLPVLRGTWNTTLRDAFSFAPTSNKVLLSVAAAALMFGTLQTTIFESTLIQNLTPGERSAMTWIERHTAPRARFLVMRGDQFWGFDAASEWFPTLTQRTSVATVQGYEWIPGALTQRNEWSQQLEKCTDEVATCVSSWIHRSHQRVQYVYVSDAPSQSSADCCHTLRSLLAADPQFRTVYSGPGGIVLRYRSGA